LADIAHSFDDSADYERFMGGWSRSVGASFLKWIAPPAGAHWLDVGCGTGIFTELIVTECSPASVSAVDPAQAQIEQARRGPVAQRADFRVADAQALPFPDATFDSIASALVINFIPDRPRALSEMRRVARPGGVVAGYVWDFAAEMSPSWPLRLGMRKIGAPVPQVPGTEESRLEALYGLFERAGLEKIAVKSTDVVASYRDFEDFWQAQTPSYSPTTKIIVAMTDIARAKLIETVRTELPACPDGTFVYSARANLIMASVPG
jgi:ubiquinone/menaquinone biosynthesis C-methylase UbiE